jgi:hypothetical protein
MKRRFCRHNLRIRDTGDALMPTGNSTNTIIPPSSKSSFPPRSWLGGLWQRRVCLVPTWRGWIVLVLIPALFVMLIGRFLCTFLTIHDPVPGGVLVLEGWIPPYAAREALEEYRRHPYLGIYVTGEPMEEGSPYIGYHNYAEFTAATIVGMGAPPESVHAVPAPLVGRDRTFTMALALKADLEREGVSAAKINLISVGPHSRRSRLIYEFAFPRSQVGMIGVTPQDFDPDHWWRTSNGVRGVISEFIAYGYARFIFQPGNN